MEWRTEADAMGTVQVPVQALWGAQTQRALTHFQIGDDRFPPLFIRQYALLKKAAARANVELEKLAQDLGLLIEQACDEIIAGEHADQFPLAVWQTGSGTQTNMNLNEVIANRANELAGQPRGQRAPVHPNDHVNLSQSSNDTFPTAMHLTLVQAWLTQLAPALTQVLHTVQQKQQQFQHRIKSGRTHMMDATPVTLGQEFSGYYHQLHYAQAQLEAVQASLQVLAIGGSAVGTGLNTHPRWAATVVRHLVELTGIGYSVAPNPFSMLASHDALVDLHGRIKLLATVLYKMAADLRLMSSGPRCGLGEITLPANEPGSSIMPGKVNPTQIEALTMVCLRVMGNDSVITMANSQGQFELNVYKPLLLHTLWESMGLLSDAMVSFNQYCLQGIDANADQLDTYLEQSLMLVTALTPHIGYDNAAAAAKWAHEHNASLKQAVITLGFLNGADYDKLVVPAKMLSP
ncbi:class II fumarate hydratase [Ketobacter sp.]|uniref:class II fumarate hydratase n=1 Tax=Ketobacter sp. TaxID=2083498 RepID=UPI000F1A5717|nr:class II fumarate hydratase [Ketobacter sp.]RLT93985.1 MAG: class II fumarate hydratase [Ketobacter sp.]